MSVSYFVRYTGKAADPEGFKAHYRGAHSEIMKQYPRIRACRIHCPVDWDDPVPVNRDQIFMLAELVFDSIEDLNFSLQSEARMRSRADFNNFPKLQDGYISHVAAETETLFDFR